MKAQRGAALMVILAILGVLGAYFALRALNSGQARRDLETAGTLAQARDALIGYGASYRDLHPTPPGNYLDQVFGFLPCPDTNNNGAAEGTCGAIDVSQAGRLPWSTLQLPSLRDSRGECLWYAVSGSAKNNPKTVFFNWDTPGFIEVRNASGTLLTSTDPHERPLAVILAPQEVIGNQTRPGAGNTECGGSNTLTDYLEGSALSPTAGALSTFVVSSPGSSTNNDMGNWITSRDLFDRIKRRSDFQQDINTMLDKLETCLAGIGTLPNPSATGKGVDGLPLTTTCQPTDPDPEKAQRAIRFLEHWNNNLLYARGGSIPGKTCDAVLIFGGERSTGQSRFDSASRNTPANYLEGSNATSFPANPALQNAGAFTLPSGAGSYHPDFPARDVIRCITLGVPPVTKSFASDFSSFTTIGSGVTANTANQSVTIADAPGTAGGCFWNAGSIPLAGKTLRAYFDFSFSHPDNYALTGMGVDRGNGFSLQLVRSDFGAPPTGCGAESNMGVLTAGSPYGYDPGGDNSLFGQRSFIFESDVRRNSGHTDPVENHSAIMINGTLDHSLSGTMSTACNGTAGGCRHNPANTFEETPLSGHNQRVEITTGCNAGCTVCNPAAHAAPNNYARITAWVNCTDCGDTATDLDRIAKPPTVQRCTLLTTELDSVYFGFTGGFRSGTPTATDPPAQGVTLRNFILRSE